MALHANKPTKFNHRDFSSLNAPPNAVCSNCGKVFANHRDTYCQPSIAIHETFTPELNAKPWDYDLAQKPHEGIGNDTKPTNPKDAIGINKAPMSTVPANVMMEVGVALLEGAAKYGRHNYRIAGIRYSVYYDALMRHAMAWWEGEDLDPDSGLSHITKAISTLVVLRDAMLNDMATDDRPPSTKRFVEALNQKAAGILTKHKDKAPRHYTIGDD